MPKYTWCGSGETHYRTFMDEYMLRYTAFIGYGIVGKSCHKAFEHNTEAIIIDPKYTNTVISDIKDIECDLAFVSVPAPTLDDDSVDASAIYDIFQQFADINYAGIVVLKSTLPPAIVYDLYMKYGRGHRMKKEGPLRYIYSPEFIREATWEQDATNLKFMILAGNYDDCDELRILYKRHSCIPSYCSFKIVGYEVAALAKYSINAYLATKVTFMNQIYQLYVDMNGLKMPLLKEEWDEFISLMSADIRIGSSHMQIPGPDGQYGYGGSCLPKDVRAFVGFDKNHRLSVLREVSEANTAIRLTGSIKSDNIDE